eukprot:363683-Chlamydomonas_euryale.AAC.5
MQGVHWHHNARLHPRSVRLCLPRKCACNSAIMRAELQRSAAACRGPHALPTLAVACGPLSTVSTLSIALLGKRWSTVSTVLLGKGGPGRHQQASGRIGMMFVQGNTLYVMCSPRACSGCFLSACTHKLRVLSDLLLPLCASFVPALCNFDSGCKA